MLPVRLCNVRKTDRANDAGAYWNPVEVRARGRGLRGTMDRGTVTIEGAEVRGRRLEDG